MARVHDANVRRIAQDIAALKQDMRVVKNRKPGLAYSSIEDGAIREYDKDGVLVSQSGKQPDGTHNHVVVNGPKPPKPAGFSASAQPGLIELRWNGKFEGDATSPLDLKHVAGYVVASGEYLDLSEQAGVMTGELGDNIQAQVTAGAYHVYFVAWSLAGKFSDAAGPVPVLVTPPADPIEIQGALDDINERYDGVITEAGNLGNRLAQAEQDLTEHDQRLGAASQRIDDAFVEIEQAGAKAQGAVDAAANAQTAADAAKSDAEDAKQEARQAAGLAGSKGEVIYQATAPTGSRASKSNLWIRTSDNKPHTYDDAAGKWVAVTDQAALDAAQEAATAQSKADAAAQAAANAQAAAGSAQQTADNALTMAGSRTSVFYSTKAPSGQGDHEGALWRQWDENKNVIGRWIWDGSSWVKDKLSSDVIDNLDVGKLTAGSGVIADLVAQTIASATAGFQRADIKNLFVTTGTMTEAVINKLWADVVMSRKITAQMMAIGSFDNLVADPSFESWGETGGRDWRDGGGGHVTVSDEAGAARTGKWGMKFVSDVPRSTNSYYHDAYISVGAGEYFKAGLHYKVAAGAGSARIRVYEYDASGSYIRSILGGGDELTASAWTKSQVTHQVSADAVYIRVRMYFTATAANTVIYADDVYCNRMNAGELLVDGAVTAEKVAANAIKAYHADFDSFFADTGFVSQLRSKGIILVDETGAETVNLTGEGENFITIRDGATGDDLVTIDESGGMSAQSLAVSGDARFDGVLVANGDPLVENHLGGDDPGQWGPIFNGRSLLGATFTNYVDQHPAVSEVNSWLTPIPHGAVTNAWNDSAAGTNAAGRWVWEGKGGQYDYRMMLVTTQEFVSGRMYSLNYRTPAIRATDGKGGTLGRALLRYSTDGGSVSADSGSTIPGTGLYLSGGGEYVTPSALTYVRCPEDIPAGKIMLGAEVYVYDGRTAESTATAVERRWEITVVDMGLRRQANDGDAVNLRKQGTDPTPTPPAPKPPKPKQYTETIGASWWQAYTGDNSQATHSTYSGAAAQGRTPYAPGNGVMRGLVGFPSQASRLSGATVKKIEVYVHAKSWHAGAGGTAVIGTHTHGSKPGSWSSSSNDVKRQKMKRGEGRWITLPSSVHAGFKSGSLRGISFYPPGGSSSTEYYGIFTGNKTKLRITYEK